MSLGSNESITFSISPAHEPASPSCSECGKIAHRIVGTMDQGIMNETPLCIWHFIDACIAFPVLQYLERECRVDPFEMPRTTDFAPRHEPDCGRSVEQRSMQAVVGH